MLGFQSSGATRGGVGVEVAQARADDRSAWLRHRATWIDRSVAAVAALLTAPLVGVLALLIWREDRGPGLVRVTRMGRGFQPFGMWKLRSMRAVHDDGTAGGHALTAQEDDRITRIGTRIRSYHLDELPQLWNVARGEMLLLGPRPEDPEYVDSKDPRWQELLAVPPGIAGPTQLVVNEWERHLIADAPDSGRYQDEVLPVKLAIDQWYLRTCSLQRDAEVAVALFKRFLPGSRATRMRRRVMAEVPEASAVKERASAERVSRAGRR